MICLNSCSNILDFYLFADDTNLFLDNTNILNLEPPPPYLFLPLLATRLRSLEERAKTGVSPRREKCASFTPAPHTKTKLPLFSTSTFIYTYFKSSDWRIAAAQAWRCCWLTRDWCCSRKSRTGFSTLLTKGEALLGACKMNLHHVYERIVWTLFAQSWRSPTVQLGRHAG